MCKHVVRALALGPCRPVHMSAIKRRFRAGKLISYLHATRRYRVGNLLLCLCECTYECACVHMCVRAHACVCVCVCVCVARVWACIWLCVCVCVSVYASACLSTRSSLLSDARVTYSGSQLPAHTTRYVRPELASSCLSMHNTSHWLAPVAA